MSTPIRLWGKGSYFGKDVVFDDDFSKNPNPHEKRFSGLKSSKGGHSIQLVVYNSGYFVKFWMVGVSKAGVIESVKKGGFSKVPHITLQYGKQGEPTKILKEMVQSKKCKSIDVDLKKFERDKEKGQAFVQGSLQGDWGEDGKLDLEFNVLVEDKGLTVK